MKDMLKSILRYRNRYKPGILIAALLVSLSLNGQGGYCGKVTDRITGAGLARATIYVIAQEKGAVTDEMGNFCLPGTVAFPCSLKVSYMGYHDREIYVDSKGPFEIVMAPEVRNLGETVITASRYERRINDIPSRMSLMDEGQINLTSAQNSDDLLRMVSNIYVNRNQGIFSRSAGLTMRGLSGTARTLVMIDGVPINKTAGGSVTWNIVRPYEIDRIEVLKGPASSVYGNNAMSGAINIITKKLTNDFNIEATIFGGTYNTYGAGAGINGRQKVGKTVLSFAAGGGFRRGGGYYLTSIEERDSIDAKAFLDEYHAHGRIGLLRKNHSLSLDYRFYDGTVGEGRKVYEPDGANDRYIDHLINFNYKAVLGSWQLNARTFLQYEQERRVSENVNRSGKYKLSDVFDKTYDYGIWVNLTRSLGKHHTLSFGTDIKIGEMDSELIYRTATDHMNYGGEMLFNALFIRDDISFGNGRWNLHIGLRFDRARFSNGFLDVTDPTTETGFLGNTSDSFTDETWNQLSPHAGIRYALTGQTSIYVSYGRGFMPPKLDDLCRSGKISKGFKIANPQLQPETVDTWEAGINVSTPSGFMFMPAVYYSLGKDFQYFVSTGDSVDTGGSDLKPVLQRQNISEVSIIGAEVEVKYEFRPGRYFYLSYAYNHTNILDYTANPEFNQDLRGKELIEVPDHIGSLGIYFTSKIMDFSADVSYTGKQWFDDGNTNEIDDHTLFNFKVEKVFCSHLRLSLAVDNLFDVRYLDRKGYRAPGRFITATASYSINPIK